MLYKGESRGMVRKVGVISSLTCIVNSPIPAVLWSLLPVRNVMEHPTIISMIVNARSAYCRSIRTLKLFSFEFGRENVPSACSDEIVSYDSFLCCINAGGTPRRSAGICICTK